MWLSFLMVACAAPVTAQQVDQNLWGTDGNVVAIARSGNTVYVAGAFGWVGPVTGGGVPVDRATGEASPAFPRVAGTVRVVIPDGAGGWFIGGSFTGVGALARTNLAHILPGGTVAAWNPSPDGEILALALNGPTLYAGGLFGNAGGALRARIAALDIATGAATSWDPSADAAVHALLIHDGRLYVGGEFSTIGGRPRNSVAELGLGTGLATAWNPDVGFSGVPGWVYALAARGDTVYLGGLFWTVGVTQSRRDLAAVDRITGIALDWNPGEITRPNDMYYGDPYVSALAIGDSTIYVGGHFVGVGGQVRGGLAEIDLDAGEVTPWNPDPGPWTGSRNRDVAALAVTANGVFVSGYFESIGGQPRRFIAEVDRTNGLATGWNPNANDVALALAASRDQVYVGGTFSGLGPLWQRRQNLAAFDATTGAVKVWDPKPDGLIVAALALAHDKVYVGGYFLNIGGQERWGLAALDTITGAATDWTPTANSEVATLELVRDTLYAGGYFTTIGGTPRNHLASFDLATGNLTAWDPNASGDVYDLAVSGNTVYVAGFFLAVGGQPRKYVASVNAITGAVSVWNPDPDVTVYSVAATESVVYIGGRFRNVGGQARAGFASLDAATGSVSPWTANVDADVYSLAIMGDTIFVGGGFSTIAGQPRLALAALDRSTGSVFDWSPNPAGGVGTLSVDGDNLYAGGYFKSMNDSPSGSLAAISFAPRRPTPTPIPPSVAITWVAPNPVRASANARFALPSTSRVTLSVFDVQGRQVSSLLHRAELPAGMHEVPLLADGLEGGFYFLRLETNGVVATRKFVVLK